MMASTTAEITLGYSPCPNDTFIFCGLAAGTITVPSCEFRTELHDVETLNAMAMSQKLDVTKLSFYAWLKLKSRYQMLDTGAAMGFGCGPILVSRRPLKKADLPDCRIALPGRWTTAHLLLRLWAPQIRDRVFTTYDQVIPMIMAGQADGGVIIHENRFTYQKEGFRPVIDLGQWWEAQTGLPIPLGCIAAKRSLGEKTITDIEAAIGKSLDKAQAEPEDCLAYMRTHAKEMDPDVLWQHVRTYVNAYSHRLGATGQAAIDALEERALAAGVLP